MTRNLSKWNFWSRYNGLLYGFRAYHPTTGRVIFAYGGKSFQPWKTRIRQHLWGGGQYGSIPKPWADTVPGWRPNGTAEEVITAGGAFLIWRGRVSPMGLWWREILFAIWLRRPYMNECWNKANPRRIPISVQYEQRRARDRGESFSGVGRVSRAVYWWQSVRRMVTWIVGIVSLIVTSVLFLPGMPGEAALAGGGEWVGSHHPELGGSVLLLAGIIWAVGRPHGTRRRRLPAKKTGLRTRRRSR